MKKKDIIGDKQFHVMCEMWGVDGALKAVKQMGLIVTKDQIDTEREKEMVFKERFDNAFQSMLGGNKK